MMIGLLCYDKMLRLSGYHDNVIMLSCSHDNMLSYFFLKTSHTGMRNDRMRNERIKSTAGVLRNYF
jgi:hypothetical protein